MAQIEPVVTEKLSRTAARRKDFVRMAPRALSVEMRVNGKRVRALIDSGSMADFMSTTLAEQLNVPQVPLEKPINIQLASRGSRTVVNYSTTVQLQYEDIDEKRHFDIMNVEGYDLILGTPFLYQHKVLIGINPPQMYIGCDVSVPIVDGIGIAKIASKAANLVEEKSKYLRNKIEQ
ncbi:hypothetical protein SISNIDRAFT_416465, partial [Sistotremastrum niveocremeum HHB9708]